MILEFLHTFECNGRIIGPFTKAIYFRYGESHLTAVYTII